MLSLALPLLLSGGVLCAELRITSPGELIELSKNVNNGIRYNGTTVYLDSDLDFSGKTIDPVGSNSSLYFNGTFDGQGYTINNLVMNSSSQYVGLFGYSKGTTIRNVVIGSSCSFTNSFTSISYKSYIGGIIGYCLSSSNSCIIESNVNMGSVSFNGSISSNRLYIGGIIGYISYFSSNHDIRVKNCANYGTVSHMGTSGFTYLGGIVGHSVGSSSKITYILNCLNYGTLLNNSTKSNIQYIGGVVGSTQYTNVENCVNSGEIASKYSSGYIGGSVSYAHYSQISHCYWDKNIAEYIYKSSSLIKNSSSFNSATLELSEAVSVGSYTGTSLIAALNAAADYYALRDYSHWAFNKDMSSVSFTVKGRTSPMITVDSKNILLPSLASEGTLWFDEWYSDSECTTPLSSPYEITTGITSLYGKWEKNTKSYIISFDTRGGTPIDPITSQFRTIVTSPTSTSRGNCTFAWWENDYGEMVSNDFIMPAHSLTLHAVWKCTVITTAADLIDFSKVVNSGLTYYGNTVYLDSDITFADELSQQFEPIGKDSSKYFRGAFDGQGYTINNLVIDFSSQYAGLFGYSKGATIRNVVIDSSCSVTSYNDVDYEHIGGIIGYCYSSSGSCIIENSVNMGSVVFRGGINRFLYIGGIIGYLYYSSYDSVVRNCANYGTTSSTGTSGSTFFGGIVGYSVGSSSKIIYIQNCLNYGTLLSNNTESCILYIGGVVGYTQYTNVEDCVNLGAIVSKYLSDYSGGITGFLEYSRLSHCYWDKVITEKLYGIRYSTSISNNLAFNSTTLELSEAVSVGSYTGKSLIAALNAAADYYALRDYSHWAFNKDMSSVSFTVKGRTSPMLTVDSKIILLPSLASEGRMWFDGWYSNIECTTAFSSPYEIISNALYGKWEENTKNYTISFDARGGTPIESITSQFCTVVSLPTSTIRDNCTFAWWENDYGEMVSNQFIVSPHNITLHTVWKCTVITTAADFVSFSKVVNSGLTYSGNTVYLNSDIVFTDELSQQFEPIGKDSSKHFQGTFDGQGYTINNLAMNSPSQDAGLFGYSQGITIRNVVIDSSCSVTSSYTSIPYDSYIGGIIGYCYSSSGSCIIENNVNMGNVSFNGNIDKYFYLGGIVGYLYYYKHNTIMRNCANYGFVVHTGDANCGYIGGIIGYSQGASSANYVVVQNSLNYGLIIFNETIVSKLGIGGNVGHSRYSIVENCVSAGKIQLNTTNTTSIGTIVGETNSYTNITHCLWTSDVGYDEVNGMGSLNITNSSIVELNSTTMSELNEYAKKNSTWSKWFMLHLNGGEVNNIKYETMIVTQKNFPIPVREECVFMFWCTDAVCSYGKYNPRTTDISKVSDLYAQWIINNYTVTFNFNNGTNYIVEFQFNSIIEYPENPEREGYIFNGWVPNPEIMPAGNITVTAQWNITNPSGYVEIVFNKMDLTEDDVKEIIQGYTNEGFTIEKFDVDEKTGEITVIIKFVEEKKAGDFIRSVNKSKDTGKNYISRIDFATNYVTSFSFTTPPMFTYISLY